MTRSPPEDTTEAAARPETAGVSVGAEEWLDAMCTAVTASRDALAVTLDLQGEVDTESASGRQRLLDDLAARLSEAETVAKRADGDLARTGIPEIRGGPDLVEDVRAGLDDLIDRLVDAHQGVERVPAGDRSTFEAALAPAVRGLDSDSPQLGTALQSVSQNPDLSPLTGRVASCRGVI